MQAPSSVPSGAGPVPPLGTFNVPQLGKTCTMAGGESVSPTVATAESGSRIIDDRDELTSGEGVTDGLTGLYTHSVLKELLEKEVVASRNKNTALSLIFADVDHFNRVNGN